MNNLQKDYDFYLPAQHEDRAEPLPPVAQPAKGHSGVPAGKSDRNYHVIVDVGGVDSDEANLIERTVIEHIDTASAHRDTVQIEEQVANIVKVCTEDGFEWSLVEPEHDDDDVGPSLILAKVIEFQNLIDLKIKQFVEDIIKDQKVFTVQTGVALLYSLWQEILFMTRDIFVTWDTFYGKI